MSSVQAAAAALRAVIPQLPKDVVKRLDSDLATMTDLLNETLAASCRQQEVLFEATSLRTGLVESLADLLSMVEHAIEEKAAQLAAQEAPAEPAPPARSAAKYGNSVVSHLRRPRTRT